MIGCKACEHPERRTIDEQIAGGRPLRRMEADYGVSRTSLARHRDNHLAARVAAEQERREQDDAEHAGAILDRLEALADAAERHAYAAILAGAGSAPSAIREARETLHRVGELRGEWIDDPAVESRTLLRALVAGVAGVDDTPNGEPEGAGQ